MRSLKLGMKKVPVTLRKVEKQIVYVLSRHRLAADLILYLFRKPGTVHDADNRGLATYGPSNPGFEPVTF